MKTITRAELANASRKLTEHVTFVTPSSIYVALKYLLDLAAGTIELVEPDTDAAEGGGVPVSRKYTAHYTVRGQRTVEALSVAGAREHIERAICSGGSLRSNRDGTNTDWICAGVKWNTTEVYEVNEVQ